MKLPRFDSGRVLVFGDVMLDRYWHGSTERISAEAPIPVVDIQEVEDRLGGAANVALNIASLGGAAGLIGAVGEDESATILRAKLGSAGIEDGLVTMSDRPTITKFRIVSRSSSSFVQTLSLLTISIQMFFNQCSISDYRLVMY